MNLVKQRLAGILGSVVVVGGLLTGVVWASGNVQSSSPTSTPGTIIRIESDQKAPSVPKVKGGKQVVIVQKAKSPEELKDQMKMLVASGKLNPEEIKDQLTALVSSGKLTQGQADQIQNKLSQSVPAGKHAVTFSTSAEMKDKFNALVASGKLTQEQADQILSKQAN